MLDIRSTSKAGLAQQLVTEILRHAGYRVSLIGVESRCPDITALGAEQYHRLCLPDALRTLPDLAAYDPPHGPLHLLEIKYVSTWSVDVLQHLVAKLQRQQMFYPTTQTVILRGRCGSSVPSEVDEIIRVLPPGDPTLITAARLLDGAGGEVAAGRLETVWRQMQPIVKTFPRLVGTDRAWRELPLRVLPALANPHV